MSDDGTRALLEKWSPEGKLRIVDNTQRTAAAGLNAAIRVARGAVIIRMDAHTEYAPDYICQCLSVLEETGADNVGGAARTKCSAYVQAAIATAYHSIFAVGKARFHNPEYEGHVDTVTYGCWRREAFDRYGFFDEELARNQDDEHNFRIILGGGKIWQSRKIRSWYKPRGSLADLFMQYAQYGYWKVRVMQKHGKPAAVRHTVPGMFVLFAILLPLISMIWSNALVLWALMFAIYVLCTLTVSCVLAARQHWTLLPLLPVVFACYHFSYGWGFLHGIWDFVIRGQRAASHYGKITRRSVRPIRG
jgi:hypothetical protein